MTPGAAPERRRGLGRGLEVLVGGSRDAPELVRLPVDSIHPNPRQPRRRFEPEASSGLARSIDFGRVRYVRAPIARAARSVARTDSPSRATRFANRRRST